MPRQPRDPAGGTEHPPDRVQGPWWSEARRRWSVRWRQDGRGRRRTFVERDDAERFAVELRARAAADRPAGGAANPALPPDPPPELEHEPSAKGWAALVWHLARRQLAAAESGDRQAVQLWARTANAIGALGKAFGAARELDEIRGGERQGLDEHGSLLLETFNEMRAVYGMAPMTEQQYERYKARFIGTVGERNGAAERGQDGHGGNGAGGSPSAAAERSKPN